MITSPIIPIWCMTLICIILIVMARSKNRFTFIRRILTIALLFVINLRFMSYSETQKTVYSNNLDVLFVVDNTISMVAEDYNGNGKRLDAIKSDCAYIADKLNGAKFSLITFANRAKTSIPYVKDVNMFVNGVKAMTVASELYAKGTSMNVALDEIINNLTGYPKKDDRKRIVFFISDGEITNEEKLKSFSKVKDYIDDGAVLGYGTNEGGKMYVWVDLYQEYQYLEDDSVYPYKTALSKIDETNLKKIASDMNVDYVHMEKTSNIDDVLSKIMNKIEVKEDEEKKITTYGEIYHILCIPFAILIVYELLYLITENPYLFNFKKNRKGGTK